MFSIDRFVELMDLDLCEYVEPFVNVHPDAIPESVYPQLLERLAEWDSVHLVYALELGVMLNSRDFGEHAVGFLAHRDSAVGCSAFRVLKNLPPSDWPLSLASKIAATPVVDLFVNDLRPGTPLTLGTNALFLRELLEHVASNPSVAAFS